MARNVGLFMLGLFALPIIGVTGIIVSRAALVMGDVTSIFQVEADKPAHEKQRAANEIHLRRATTGSTPGKQCCGRTNCSRVGKCG